MNRFLSLHLHCDVRDLHVALDKRLLVRAIEPLHRRPVQVDLVVDDQQRVARVHHVVVDADSVEVLLQQTLEEHVFFFERRLLLVDGHLVQKHFVVAFEEVVQRLELIVHSLVESVDLVQFVLRLVFYCVGLGLVKGQDFLSLGLEFAAELGRLEYFLAELLVALERVHAGLRVLGQV